VLRDFAERQRIPFPLLSDVDSEVIRRYGVLNDQLDESDGMLYGIPYPGVFVTDEHGVVITKIFHDSYKKRDSPELLIDAALGRVQLDAAGRLRCGSPLPSTAAAARSARAYGASSWCASSSTTACTSTASRCRTACWRRASRWRARRA